MLTCSCLRGKKVLSTAWYLFHPLNLFSNPPWSLNVSTSPIVPLSPYLCVSLILSLLHTPSLLLLPPYVSPSQPAFSEGKSVHMVSTPPLPTCFPPTTAWCLHLPPTENAFPEAKSAPVRGSVSLFSSHQLFSLFSTTVLSRELLPWLLCPASPAFLLTSIDTSQPS